MKALDHDSPFGAYPAASVFAVYASQLASRFAAVVLATQDSLPAGR